MRATLFLVAALLAGVAVCDIVSTNPDQDPFFSSQTVRNLPINSVVSSTIFNQTGYTEFYYVWIPSYVGEVTYYLNVTNGDSDECDSDVEIYFITSNFQEESSFPCDFNGGSESAMCDTYDHYLYTYYDTNDLVISLYNDLRPGRYHYLSVFNDYQDYNCDYTLQVVASLTCPNTTVPMYVDSENTTCSSFYNYTNNGQNIASTLNTTDSWAVYGVQVPLNVSRIWAFVSTSADYLYFTVQQQFATYSYDNAIDYEYYGYQNTTNNLYNYYVEVQQPENGWVFFTVRPYDDLAAPLAYNITISWNYCGASYAGLGDWDVDVYVPAPDFTIPDCNVPVVQSINLTTQSAWTFNVPRYNDTTDYEYAGQYAAITVPWGTTGYVNLTCNTTDTTSDSFVVFAKNYVADCYDYDYRIDCSYVGETDVSGEYFYLISQDLFTGGQWNVGACNDNSVNAVTIVLSNHGAVAAPAAPSPSASPSPGSQSTGGNSSPSPSPGSDSGSSGSVSSTVLPFFALVAVAALFSLLF